MTGSKQGPFVAGNWKMHLTRPEAWALAQKVAMAMPGLQESRIVLIPPFTALGDVGAALAG